MQRTNYPVQLTSHRDAPFRNTRTHNIILDLARDCYDGSDLFGWGMELLYATQELRMAYDSPRIGGGIDPALATKLPPLKEAADECPILGYMIGDRIDPTNTLAEYHHLYGGDYIQNCIVHAEAVAIHAIDFATALGKEY